MCIVFNGKEGGFTNEFVHENLVRNRGSVHTISHDFFIFRILSVRLASGLNGECYIIDAACTPNAYFLAVE